MSNSSPDTARSPTSPFFHNLSQRLRKGSIASHGSSQGSEVTNNLSRQASAAATQQKESSPVEKPEDAQSTKRYLLSIVRQDWEYPDTSPSEKTALPTRSPINYKRREESVSDLESDAGIRKNPYKFDNPDAIGTSIRQRKRRKRKLIEEEMVWNEGLRFWTLQRDAWTGATLRQPNSTAEVNGEYEESKQTTAAVQPSERRSDHDRDGSASTGASEDTAQSAPSTSSWPLPEKIEEPPESSSSSVEPPLVSTSPVDMRDVEHTAVKPPKDQSAQMSITKPSENLVEGHQQHNDSVSQEKSEETSEAVDGNTSEGPYLPIYPPLLPQSHALRARIKPAVYTTIYEKVVIQSLTPNVPIPLTNMIGALVVGWKSEGNWPPPGSNMVGPGTGIASRGAAGKGRKAGESAFAKWRRDQDEKRKASTVADGVDVPEGRERVGRGRRSLSSAMKKVFGFGSGDADRTWDEMTEEERTKKDLEEIGLTFSQCEETEQDKEDNVQLNKGLVP